MEWRRLTVALVVLNVILLALFLSPIRPAYAQPSAEAAVPVLRARSLEIVDPLGRTRAQIVVAPASTVDGVPYPETVLFRLIDSRGQPSLKIAVSDQGSGMDLLGGPDDQGWYGVQVIASEEQNMLKVVDRQGRSVVLRP